VLRGRVFGRSTSELDADGIPDDFLNVVFRTDLPPDRADELG